MMFASHGDQIGLAKLVQGYRLSAADGHYISTKAEGKKSVKLKVNEIVLQVTNSTFSSIFGFNVQLVTYSSEHWNHEIWSLLERCQKIKSYIRPFKYI